MTFSLTSGQLEWRVRAQSLAGAWPAEVSVPDVVRAAARAGLLAHDMELLSAAVAVEGLACESAPAAVAYALHAAVVMGVRGVTHVEALGRGEQVGAIALSSDFIPTLDSGRLSGRASWVAPLPAALAVVGAQRPREPGKPDADPVACIVALGAPGVSIETLPTAALRGLTCGHLTLQDAPCEPAGSPIAFMARIRVLLAAAGLGMGRRAVREALATARTLGRTGAGGEQTVQGLLADAATEIDAAKLLTWKAASARQLSLAEASMAKLAATDATQRAVARATQVLGAESFREGHVIERLAQDVRALELFAGRTEALREAVAAELLPREASRT